MAPAPDAAATSRRTWVALAVLTALGAAVRLYWVLALHPPGDFVYSDMSSYVDRARSLLAGHYGEFDWIYPPGTSAFLAPWMKLDPAHWQRPAAMVQALLSAAEIPLVFVAARRWFGPRVGLIAAAGFTFHFLSIDYCGFFSSESPLTLALVLAGALMDPRNLQRAGFAGLALGFGCLCKPQAVMLVPLWMGLLAVQRRWPAVVALAIGVAAPTLPASYAVSRATHQVQFVSAMGGVVMTQAWCPVKDVNARGPGWSTGFGLPVVGQRGMRGEPEATWGHANYEGKQFVDAHFYGHEGMACIARFPRHAFRTLLRHVVDTFAGPPWSYEGPWPDAFTSFRTLTMLDNAFVAWVLLPLALFAWTRGQREPGVWYLVVAPVLSCVVNCAVFHGEPRFRVPYDFALWIGAAVAIAELVPAWRGAAPASELGVLPAPFARVRWVRVLGALALLAFAAEVALERGIAREARAHEVVHVDGPPVMLFADEDLHGRMQLVDADEPDLGARHFDDTARALRLHVGLRATFFADKDFQGPWFTLNCPTPVGEDRTSFCDVQRLGSEVQTGFACGLRELAPGCKGFWDRRISSVRIEGPALEHLPQGRIAAGG